MRHHGNPPDNKAASPSTRRMVLQSSKDILDRPRHWLAPKLIAATAVAAIGGLSYIVGLLIHNSSERNAASVQILFNPKGLKISLWDPKKGGLAANAQGY